MILNDFKIFPKKGSVLGIDWGKKRIGIAISDIQQKFVFIRPVCAHLNMVGQLNFITNLINTEKIVAIVVGLPLFSDGTESETTALVKQFVHNLEQLIAIPIYLIEENLTSYEAQMTIKKITQKAIKQELDSLSAKIILENALSIVNRI